MKYVFELCKGRHTTPAENAIFSNSVNPTDVDALFDEAWGKIPEDCDALDVYVTGLTVAMLAVVILIIASFTYYTSVAQDEPFKSRFWEMALISIGVAVMSFFVGILAKKFLGVDI